MRGRGMCLVGLLGKECHAAVVAGLDTDGLVCD